MGAVVTAYLTVTIQEAAIALWYDHRFALGFEHPL